MSPTRGGKRAIGAAFAAAAPAYDAAAHIQAETAALLAARIAAAGIAPAPRILELGCGTGLLTQALLGHFPDAWVLATDLAPAMVRQCRRRVGAAVQYAVMDAERPSVRGAGSLDLVCANLAFQWLETPDRSIAALADLVAPGGLIAFTTMAAGSFAEWRRAADEAGIGHGTPTYPAPDWWQDLLPNAEISTETISRAYPSLHGFLAELKQLGAHVPDAHHLPASPGALRRVFRRFPAPAGLTITWQIAVIVARLPG